MSRREYLDQLRERVECLEKNLKHAVASIEAEVTQARELIAKISRTARGFDELLVEQQRIQSGELTDISDRLMHIERFLFPTMHRDLKDIQNIIGENDGGAGRLDRREI